MAGFAATFFFFFAADFLIGRLPVLRLLTAFFMAMPPDPYRPSDKIEQFFSYNQGDDAAPIS